MKIFNKICVIVLLLVVFISGRAVNANGLLAGNTAPTVNSTNPASGAIDVAINQKIAVTFSEAMKASTITKSTFKFKRGTKIVSGKVIYSGVTAIFTPSKNLKPNTKYTATIKTKAKDRAGNKLARRFVWSFTTGASTDNTAPTVNSTNPASGAIDMAINQKIAVTFSEEMDPSTITKSTFKFKRGAKIVSGKVSYVGVTAIFTPSKKLKPNTKHTVTIKTKAKDLAGNKLARRFVWSFTTGADTDVTAPTVSSTVPANAATGVVLNMVVNATFSEDMNPSTITQSTFKLKQGMVSISGKVTYSGLTAKFTPSSELESNTVYTATITTKAKNLAGNKLASAFVWSFTTGTETGRLPVDLGLAGNYAILAKSGISTTGSTLVTGNIGVSPIDSTAITGFGLILDASNQFATSSLVVGKVYAADYAGPTPANLTTAVSNMETAYTDAAGRTLPDATELGAGEIGGMTIAPGLYKWSSGVLITTDVTLNGGPEDVWIFQIAEDLTVASGKSVILSGGAQAKNIFWQIAGGVGVEIGTTAHMEGIVLAQKAIHVKTGASWNGMALAQTAVTLEANTITKPD